MNFKGQLKRIENLKLNYTKSNKSGIVISSEKRL